METDDLTPPSSNIRWEQRFSNYRRALALLEEPCTRGALNLSRLEQDGFARVFEFTFELAWKTIKDFLQFSGIDVSQFPRDIIKQAFSAEIIKDGQLWIEMLDHRNGFAHRYDEAMLESWLLVIDEKYLPAFLQLRDFFAERLSRP